MSRAKWGAGLNLCLAIAIQFAPVPEVWKTGITIAAIIGIIICLLGWARSNRSVSQSEFGQNVSVKDAMDVVSAADHSSASKISTGAGNVNAPIAGRDVNYFHPPPSEPQPHIHSRLRIDSLAESGWIRIRFELTNGNVPVQNIRKSYKSLRNNVTEHVTLTGSMAPGAEIVTLYEHIKRTQTDDDLVILTLYFDAQIGSDVKHYISEHHFFICKDDLVPRTLIKPARIDYRKGELPPYDIREAFEKPLARVRGHIGFVQPETSPGDTPTVISCNVPPKLFNYDGQRRLVTFRITTPSGHVINLQLPFKPVASGLHDVYFDWRPTGGKLRVDGQEISQYDE